MPNSLPVGLFKKMNLDARGVHHKAHKTEKLMRKRSLVSLVLLLALAGAASAHAILLEATPAVNAVVAGPVITLRLRFNARIDAARSRLIVVLPDRSSRTLALEPQSSADILRSRASGLTKGAYKLRWQVLAADGHITRGEIPFVVK
jgi:methionine-rich copper-binding protein CopC